MRDPRRQDIFGNSFKVTFPDFPGFERQPRYVTLMQGIGKHDVVELYFQSFSTFLEKSIKTGVPVEITYKNDKVKSKFVGYAYDTSHPTRQTLEKPVKVYCMGASFPLKERKSPKIWTNVTASDVALDIAKYGNLTPKVTPHKTRFSQISLTGHTRWEKLNELASKIGYGVQVFGTELHFHPIDKMIDQFMTTIPILSHEDPYTNPQSHFSAQTLDFFEANVGDFIESSKPNRTQKVVYGVDPITSKVYKSTSSPNTVGQGLRVNTSDPLFTTVETSVVTASDLMTQDMADGKAQHSRFSIPGKGTAQGEPRIFPWATIQVEGTGSTTDGFWVVDTASHTIHYDGRYKTEFTCVSDGTGLNQATAVRPPMASEAPVVDTSSALDMQPQTSPSSYTLSSAEAMITDQSGGYLTTPRRWVGA